MPFLPGIESKKTDLLWRFLPPLPVGITSEFLSDYVDHDSLLFDPFGYSPNLILEAARQGYKVLVSANNPIARFLLELGANPPNKETYQSALAELAVSRIGDERLEVHLQNLYKSSCAQCGQGVIAKAFIWEREADAPYAKIYECDHCGDSGERPVIQADIQLAKSFSTDSLQRMRILERIADPGDPIRANTEEALSVYLPRAIYGLVTLINRLDGLLVPNPMDEVQLVRQKALIALILNSLDKGNNLWSHPSGRTRPKQLTSSPRFREHNLWTVIEDSVVQLASDQQPIPFLVFPDLAKEGGGITIFEGPIRDLSHLIAQSDSLEGIDIKAILSAIPRHNQAYWTLSALWTGLIWGKDSIGSFKTVLRRRRYDWSWHASALHYAFNSMTSILPPGIPFFGLIGEASSNFLSASIIAAHRAGFRIQGLALRAESNQAQILWKEASVTGHQLTAFNLLEEQIRHKIVDKGIIQLAQRGEPATYLSIHTSALMTISENSGISEDDQISSADEYNRINSLVEDITTYKHGFIRYGGSEKSPETSRLWHQSIIEPGETLSDQVESAIVNFLRTSPGSRIEQVDHFICQSFPGLSTPDFRLVVSCVESYSEEDQKQRRKIFIRTQDDAEQRSKELIDIQSALHELGKRLGFNPEGEHPVIWLESDGRIRLVFYLSASACISETVHNNTYAADQSIIVIPGARANLILYKLRTNPALRNEIDQGWRFVKFRHLRHLWESPSLNRENLDSLLDLDPLTETPAQMRLL
jgi:hypothetical protein